MRCRQARRKATKLANIAPDQQSRFVVLVAYLQQLQYRFSGCTKLGSERFQQKSNNAAQAAMSSRSCLLSLKTMGSLRVFVKSCLLTPTEN